MSVRLWKEFSTVNLIGRKSFVFIRMDSEDKPRVVITEQPQANCHRFRYECERRGFNTGSIFGVNSTNNRRTYPTVEIRGYEGPAQVHVFCVTASDPPQLHPHKIVSQTERNQEPAGEVVINVDSGTGMRVSFSNLSVQCVKRSDVTRQLRRKPQVYVNIFGDPVQDIASIDLTAVRLCFLVFLKTVPGLFMNRLPPVFSTVIYDKKSNPELAINDVSDCTAPVTGQKKVILLCEKVNKADIQVRFFQDRPNGTRWEAYGTLAAHNVHKQVAITTLTPAYDDPNITEEQQVKVQLLRPSDQTVSEPVDFVILPNLEVPPRKRMCSMNVPLDAPDKRHGFELEPIYDPQDDVCFETELKSLFLPESTHTGLLPLPSFNEIFNF